TERIDDGNHMEEARPAQPDIAAEPQDGDLLPLVRYLDGKQQIDADQESRDDRRPASEGCSEAHTGCNRNSEQARCYRADLIFIAISPHGTYLLFLPASLRKSCSCSINSSTVNPSEPARAANSPTS